MRALILIMITIWHDKGWWQKKLATRASFPNSTFFDTELVPKTLLKAFNMTKTHIQQCTRFSKINHSYFFLDAVRRKDYLNICRHFLWQLNRQNNQPLTQKSIVSTIASLTEYGGIDSRILANVLTDMKKSGEIERFKGIHNRLGWNPDITNQVQWSFFNSSYNGSPIRIYSKDEDICLKDLLKLSNANSYIPRDLKDFEHTEQLIRDEEMSALIAKVDEQSSKIEKQSSQLKQVTDQLDHITTVMNQLVRFINQDDLPKAKSFLTVIEGGKKE